MIDTYFNSVFALNKYFYLLLLGIICNFVANSLLVKEFQNNLTSLSTNITLMDIYVPLECHYYANVSDHLLLSFTLQFENGTIGTSISQPNQLFHMVLADKSSSDVHYGLQGLCLHAKRRLVFGAAKQAKLSPLLLQENLSDEITSITIDFELHHLTNSSNFMLFDAIDKKDLPYALDLIENTKDARNAVDQYGQSALIAAINHKALPIIASLLNARYPTIDINFAKSSGMTAIFYAVQSLDVGILETLLKRGANANVQALQGSSKGNTPLHIACLLEKVKHAEILLKYGANPNVVNQYGKTPLQVVPIDSVKSVKVGFTRLFDVSVFF